jgi:hypothetical protein
MCIYVRARGVEELLDASIIWVLKEGNLGYIPKAYIWD